jgi:hypothetical protein
MPVDPVAYLNVRRAAHIGGRSLLLVPPEGQGR